MLINQASTHGIVRNVSSHAFKASPLNFMVAQHVVMGLLLPSGTSCSQNGCQLPPNKLNEKTLTGLMTPACDEDVQVIGHQAVNRAGDLITGASM